MTLVVAPGKQILYNLKGVGSILFEGDTLPADIAGDPLFVAEGFAVEKGKASARKPAKADPAPKSAPDVPAAVVEEPPPAPDPEPDPPVVHEKLTAKQVKATSRDELLVISAERGVDVGDPPGTKAEIAKAINQAAA